VRERGVDHFFAICYYGCFSRATTRPTTAVLVKEREKGDRSGGKNCPLYQGQMSIENRGKGNRTSDAEKEREGQVRAHMRVCIVLAGDRNSIGDSRWTKNVGSAGQTKRPEALF